ncbi:MAG: hypothetical protein OXI74_05455 [Rhodospirillaceae bacterium]|nr:hypothetical protein [Rhodospirillaceae bacterium]
MAEGKASTMDRVSALIAAIEAEAYARGKADARKELMEILGGAESGAKPVRANRGRRRAKSTPKRRTGGGKRAPRGSVRRFVDRVLREHSGSTVPEIAGHAADDTERSVKVASIRVELRNGRIQGRYVSDNGRWSHAGTDVSVGAPAEAASSGPETGASPDPGRPASGSPLEGSDTAGSEPDDAQARGTLGLNL